MILFYDCETTGIPNFNARSADPNQPHIVQLALLLRGDDGEEISSSNVLVRPEGWTIPQEMTAIHGVSHERALAEGIPESEACAMFILAQGRAALRVAHNESFDRRIMRIGMTRAGMDKDFIMAIENRPNFCTCLSAKPVLQLPATQKMIAAGIPGPKSPKLEECMQYFFGETLDGAHDALVDVRACARVYDRLNGKVAA